MSNGAAQHGSYPSLGVTRKQMRSLTYDASYFEVRSLGDLEFGAVFSATIDGQKHLCLYFDRDGRKKVLFLAGPKVVALDSARLPLLVVEFVGPLMISPDPLSHAAVPPKGLGIFIGLSGMLSIFYDNGTTRIYLDPSDGIATEGVTAGDAGLYFSDWTISQWRDGTEVVLFASGARAALPEAANP